MKELHCITTPEAACLLTSEQGRELMRPFMAHECSLSDAASELGMSLSALSYHVKQLLEAGLIEVVREQKRKGRPVKVYRASALQYCVPFALTTAESLENLFDEMERGLTALIHKNVVRLLQRMEHEWEVFLSFDLEAEKLSYGFKPPGMDWRYVFSEFLLHPTAPAVFSSSGTLELTFEEAKALQRTLEDIRKRALEKRGGQKYLYRLALVPLESEG